LRSPRSAGLGQKGQPLTAGSATEQCRIVLWVENTQERERTVAGACKRKRHLNGQSGSWRYYCGYQYRQRRIRLGSLVLSVEHDRQGSVERVYQPLEPVVELVRAREDRMFDANEYEVASLPGLSFERTIAIGRFDLDKLIQGHRRC
jgi:hypothetical protein